MFSRLVPQAGGIVFRVTSGRPLILLVKAKKNPGQWIFPKGHIEKGENAEEVAIREVREESGVEARIVRELRPMLRFRSGEERVGVRYFLMEFIGEAASREREKSWVSSNDALDKLHPDAARLLWAALYDLEEETGCERSTPDCEKLFLAEYSHIADSLLKNEADGERRAAFFMTVAGAAAGVLTFLAGRGPDALKIREAAPLIAAALAVLFAFGYLTFLRVVERNLASDRYKLALNRIRRTFLSGRDDPRRPFLAFDPFAPIKRPRPSWKSFGRGGWLHTIAFVESVIAGGFAALVISRLDSPLPMRWVAGSIALVCGFTTWSLLLWDARRRYAAR
jgi:8-oxo-dGTP pyrophosphatase MutT (NUDIX family)